MHRRTGGGAIPRPPFFCRDSRRKWGNSRETFGKKPLDSNAKTTEFRFQDHWICIPRPSDSTFKTIGNSVRDGEPAPRRPRETAQNHGKRLFDSRGFAAKNRPIRSDDCTEILFKSLLSGFTNLAAHCAAGVCAPCGSHRRTGEWRWCCGGLARRLREAQSHHFCGLASVCRVEEGLTRRP